VNVKKLKEAEKSFFERYPGGFQHPLMLEIIKKHKPEKMHNLATESFSKDDFLHPFKVVDCMAKVVSQSSMISIFEKPKFRDFVKTINDSEKESLAHGLFEFLHSDQRFGFELMAGLLSQYNIAKWPLLTVFGVYYNPSIEVMIKPTTVKQVIEYFELEGIKYCSKPSYEFYREYRDYINLMKKQVDVSLQSDNAAFSGFLMMTMNSSEEADI
jgi:hypothetical protein